MGIAVRQVVFVPLAMAFLLALASPAWSQGFPQLFAPEQRRIQVRDPAELPHARIPDVPDPATVSEPQPELTDFKLSLDEAIRMALTKSEVVRVLAGVAAVSSGRTIYDTAITNTTVDQQQARFDPRLQVNNAWNRTEQPSAAFDPVHAGQSQITGVRSDAYALNTNLSQDTATGGTVNLGVNANPSRLQAGPWPLNPATRSAVELSYTQPLLQGGGLAVNRAPLVLARLDTERSYFQFKDSVQELVRSTIEGYWALVFARTDLLVREQQVEQAMFVWRRASAKSQAGIIDEGELSQSRVSLASFKANLISAQANVIQREAALRNILGLPPMDGQRLVPVTQPATEEFKPEWRGLLALAEERRPDLIELKLVLEADQQALLQSQNQALPRADAVALYRWNGLEGEMPNGGLLRSQPGQFTDWTLGVNFSVPLGLRQGRASVRRAELLIARDRSNLEQGLHSVVHQLALHVRNLSQYYKQYLAFRDLRDAADRNVEFQLGQRRQGKVDFLYVLQAITDSANASSNEANSLIQYNVQLATLERETGTILETHGIAFYEERNGSLGPLGRWCDPACYPAEMQPTENTDRYPVNEKPSEEFFNLKRLDSRREAPPLRRVTPVP